MTKIKILQLPQMLGDLLDEQREVLAVTKRYVLGLGVDLFSVQANKQSVIPGLRRNVGEICALLRYYAAWSGNSLPKFRDEVSVPSSRVKHIGPVKK
jgi:hypothetical protein